jgi:hypothetical protein
MRGAEYAVRERIYSHFAQQVGICTQSSLYVVVSADAPPIAALRSPDDSDRYQLGLLLLAEHAPDPCDATCPLAKATSCGTEQAMFNSWLNSGIVNPWDWFEAEILGYLCAKHEPSGQLITRDHRNVQIDNELMFGGWPFVPGPVSEHALRYLREESLMTLDGAQRRALALCERIVQIPPAKLESLCEVPEGYRAEALDTKILDWLLQARSTAEHFLLHGLSNRTYQC